ncbi:hypothetical protein [Hyphomicrobium sp. 99]|uniref:hypothetical protein n=1 Tax=Hyphomicrobium sp. 99 TaxID=1163419 RepID=UPI0005F839C8|nr:hypothetical protein [Hyphomicrobium sp. 99]
MPKAEQNARPEEYPGATGSIIPHPALRRLANIRCEFERSFATELSGEAWTAQLKQNIEALALWRSTAKGTLIRVAIFSIFANLSMLALPVFLFQISDKVALGHGLVPPFGLPLLTLILLTTMSMLDIQRSRILYGLASAMETILGGALMSAMLRSQSAPERGYAQDLRSLHKVRGFLGSPTMLLLFDAPMLPFFFGAIILINTSLGAIVLISALALRIWALKSASVLFVARAITSVAILAWNMHLALAGTITIGMSIAASVIAGRALHAFEGMIKVQQSSMQAWAEYIRVCRALDEENARWPSAPPTTTNVVAIENSEQKSRHIAISC